MTLDGARRARPGESLSRRSGSLSVAEVSSPYEAVLKSRCGQKNDGAVTGGVITICNGAYRELSDWTPADRGGWSLRRVACERCGHEANQLLKVNRPVG